MSNLLLNIVLLQILHFLLFLKHYGHYLNFLSIGILHPIHLYKTTQDSHFSVFYNLEQTKHLVQ